MKNVLVLAAHPDDETLGAGATISRLSSEGHNVRLLTFTDGESARGTVDKNRNSKLESVSKILGIKSFKHGNFPDNAMDSIPLLELIKFIESNKDFDPDIVFTHNQSDLNIDHSLVYRATITALRPQYGKNMSIYSYFVPSATDYNPDNKFNGSNAYFNLCEADVQKKMKALDIYEDEMKELPHARSREYVRHLMRVWGCEVGVESAEKFKLVRSLV